ncbi:MAG: MraY family glycosyltransferase [Planctomycetota bacterium]
MLVSLAVALFASALICSAVLSIVLRRVAPRLGLVDRPGRRKIHHEPMPLGGGIAIFGTTAGIIVAALVFAIVQAAGGVSSWLPGVLRSQLPLAAGRAPVAFYVLAGGAVIFALGLIDDVRGLPPWVRIAVQGAVAAALYFLSEDLRLTGFAEWPVLPFVYTVLWIVGLTNAFNLLDNMDGLSAGVGVIVSLVFTVVAVLTEQYFMAATLLVFGGALLGFLGLNFPPASLFMGDAGSMFVGYMLSVVTILFTFFVPGEDLSPVPALLTPIVVMAVPLYDTISVVLIRLGEGRPIMSGDKRHFSHRLVDLGMTPRAAVLTIYLVTLCTGLLAPLLLLVSAALSWLVLVDVGLMLVLVWLLEHAGRVGRTREREPL